MRILMSERIIDRHVGGNTTYARNVAQGLEARGIEVGRIPMRARPEFTMLQETMTGLGKGRPGELLHYIADTGPLLRTRRPSVVTVHGVASRWIDAARTGRQEWIWRTRVQRAIASTDHVITVSHSSADDICEIFDLDPSRLTTIPHGIDFARFATPTQLSVEVAEKVPNTFALYVGNIEPRKNLVPLIDAFESSRLRRLGIPLVVAGKPAWNSEPAMARISEARNVIYLGFVSDEDRTALMQTCACFVFPSLYEGFGFPVLEALAAGAFVLTSDRGSLKEVAGPAHMISDLHEEGIAASVEAALTDATHTEEDIAAGREWARGFSWEASVDQHIAVYERVLSAR